MSKFAIGDQVKVNNYNEIGTVKDVFCSETNETSIYLIKFDDHEAMWKEESLEKYVTPISYEYEFEYLEKVVVARLYEVTEDSKTEIGMGHGHIFHEGAVGIAQAASYALKKLYYKLADMEE